jgi:hypothetical protein
MGNRNRHSLRNTLVLFSSVAFVGQISTARAQSATTDAPKGDETTKAAPPAETTEKAAAPAAESVPPPAPATPKCECPPPCPPPPPPPPPAPAPDVEWKAQSKGGMLITSGNAQAKSFTFGVNASRKEGNNKLALEGGLAYGTTNSLVANADNVSARREQITTTNNWAAKGRYDRFITDNNTAFAGAQGAGDKIAGKSFFGGGQLGYSRQVLKDPWNLVVAELGYDFSYERYVQPAEKTLDPVSIHSARVFVGETLSLTKETGVTASVEALFNLNKEAKAINAKSEAREAGVDAFKDIRLNAKLGLSTNLWNNLSFGFSVALKYDQNPAPRPIPKNAAAGFAYASNDDYFADKLDTLTEATLIYTFF